MLREFGGGLAVPHGEVEGIALDREFRGDLVVPLRAVGHERRHDLHRFVRIILGDIHQRVGAGAGMPDEGKRGSARAGAGSLRQTLMRRLLRTQKRVRKALVHDHSSSGFVASEDGSHSPPPSPCPLKPAMLAALKIST